MPSQVRTRKLSLGGMLAVLVILGGASPAAAALDPGAYTVVSGDYLIISDSPGLGSRTTNCPAGMRVVTGGAYLHSGDGVANPSLNAYLSGNAPAADALGWYGSAISWDGADLYLRVTAYCLPTESFGPYSVRTRDIDVAHNASAGARVACPTGKRVVSGGVFWHATGDPAPVAQEGYVRSSGPLPGRTKWFGAGFNDNGSTLVMTIRVLCRPQATLPYSVVTKDISFAADQAQGSSALCPTGKRVVAGGAWWHRPGEGPDHDINAYVRASHPLPGPRRWYAGGVAFEAARLKIVALCLPA